MTSNKQWAIYPLLLITYKAANVHKKGSTEARKRKL